MNDNFEELFGPIIGKGSQATVYANGEFAIKLYREDYPKRNVFSEAYIMANLEEVNFPSPKVYEVISVNGQYGLRMDQVKGKLMSEDLNNPVKTQETMDDIIALQYRLQKYEDANWDWAPNIKVRMSNDLKLNDRLSPATQKKLLKKLESLPEGNDLCHCDFHTDNVFVDGENYIIIDLLQISKGDFTADAACSYVAYSLINSELADYYLNQYCNVAGISKERVLQWLPIYAGTLLGQVPEEFSPIIERFISEGNDL